MRRGFTLIETIIATSIFVIAGVAASSIFLSAQKATQRTIAGERVGADVRWVMERMAEDIRLSAVDYSQFIGGRIVANPLKALPLITEEDASLVYGLSANPEVCGAADVQCITVTRGSSSAGEAGPAVEAAMTPVGINVRRLAFYVWPTADPFALAGDGRVIGQPKVTIVLETETIGTRKEEQARISLQTTVSTRVYKR